MKTWRWALAPLALVLIASPATAGDDPGERGPRDPERRQKLMDEFDADGDGELSQEERQALRAKMKERRGERGTRGEGKRARGDKGPGNREARPPRGPRPDGPRGPRPDGPPGPPDPEKVFEQFDADDDGMLSKDEFMQLTREMRRRHGPPPHGGEGRHGPRDGRRGGEGRPDRPAPDEAT